DGAGPIPPHRLRVEWPSCETRLHDARPTIARRIDDPWPAPRRDGLEGLEDLRLTGEGGVVGQPADLDHPIRATAPVETDADDVPGGTEPRRHEEDGVRTSQAALDEAARALLAFGHDRDRGSGGRQQRPSRTEPTEDTCRGADDRVPRLAETPAKSTQCDRVVGSCPQRRP